MLKKSIFLVCFMFLQISAVLAASSSGESHALVVRETPSESTSAFGKLYSVASTFGARVAGHELAREGMSFFKHIGVTAAAIAMAYFSEGSDVIAYGLAAHGGREAFHSLVRMKELLSSGSRVEQQQVLTDLKVQIDSARDLMISAQSQLELIAENLREAKERAGFIREDIQTAQSELSSGRQSLLLAKDAIQSLSVRLCFLFESMIQEFQSYISSDLDQITALQAQLGELNELYQSSARRNKRAEEIYQSMNLSIQNLFDQFRKRQHKLGQSAVAISQTMGSIDEILAHLDHGIEQNTRVLTRLERAENQINDLEQSLEDSQRRTELMRLIMGAMDDIMGHMDDRVTTAMLDGTFRSSMPGFAAICFGLWLPLTVIFSPVASLAGAAILAHPIATGDVEPLQLIGAGLSGLNDLVVHFTPPERKMYLIRDADGIVIRLPISDNFHMEIIPSRTTSSARKAARLFKNLWRSKSGDQLVDEAWSETVGKLVFVNESTNRRFVIEYNLNTERHLNYSDVQGALDFMLSDPSCTIIQPSERGPILRLQGLKNWLGVYFALKKLTLLGGHTSMLPTFIAGHSSKSVGMDHYQGIFHRAYADMRIQLYHQFLNSLPTQELERIQTSLTAVVEDCEANRHITFNCNTLNRPGDLLTLEYSGDSSGVASCSSLSAVIDEEGSDLNDWTVIRN